jgi:hypothetical protein
MIVFAVAPNSLLNINGTESKMMKFQLSRAGLYDPWSLAEALEIPNYGAPPKIPLPPISEEKAAAEIQDLLIQTQMADPANPESIVAAQQAAITLQSKYTLDPATKDTTELFQFGPNVLNNSYGDIGFTGATQAIAMGSTDRIARTVDGGDNWTIAAPVDSTRNWQAVDFISPSEGYAITESGGFIALNSVSSQERRRFLGIEAQVMSATKQRFMAHQSCQFPLLLCEPRSIQVRVVVVVKAD